MMLFLTGVNTIFPSIPPSVILSKLLSAPPRDKSYSLDGINHLLPFVLLPDIVVILCRELNQNARISSAPVEVAPLLEGSQL